jgi:hypothetical protein
MGKDKILHFLVSEIIVMVLVIILNAVGLYGISFAIAPVVTLALGLGKELHDRKTTGFDKWDLIMDFLGTATGLALVFAAIISTIQ